MSSAEHPRRVTVWRRLVRAAAVAVLLVVVMAWSLRWSDARAHLVIATAALGPYLVVPALAATTILWWTRARVRAGVGAVVCVAVLWTQGAVLVPSTGGATTPRLTVMTANLHLGGADPKTLAAAVIRERVDVLMLEELTPTELDRLRRAGLARTLPFVVDRSRTGAEGIAILSRYRLGDSRADDRFFLGLVQARLEIDGRDGPLVAAVHISGPYPQDASGWRTDLHRLGPTLRSLTAGETHGVVVAGDFNATRDNAPFRSALGTLRDASDLSGQPLVRTYPGDAHIPPVMAIDHVLTDRRRARDVRTVGLPGSDHRALIADISLR